MSWELQIFVKAWIDPKDREVKQLILPILERLIWSCMKGRNKETSATKIDMSVVTLQSKKLKSWQRLRLEGTIGKWPEARRVAAHQLNVGSVVAEAASISVSQSKSFFLQGAKTAMKINGAIAGDSDTGRKKLATRQ